MAIWHRKTLEVSCPSCGHHQLECQDYVSTICRACGYAFSRAEAELPRAHLLLPTVREASPTVLSREISVTCYRCGFTHEASLVSLSTQCPSCQTFISFASEVIDRPVSRSIDTRGDLLITKTGNFFSPQSICRHATIRGKISGALFCEGRLLLCGQGSLPCKFRAKEVLIPRGAEISCPFPIEAQVVVVRGRIQANLLLHGTLKILRQGRVEGSVLAKSILVDRGGQLLGQVRISPEEFAPPLSGFDRAAHQSLQPVRKLRRSTRRVIY